MLHIHLLHLFLDAFVVVRVFWLWLSALARARGADANMCRLNSSVEGQLLGEGLLQGGWDMLQ